MNNNRSADEGVLLNNLYYESLRYRLSTHQSDLASSAKYAQEPTIPLLTKLSYTQAKQLFESMPYVATIIDTLPCQSRFTVVDFSGNENTRSTVSRVGVCL